LIFPTTGCWEVTGRVGESSLTFVTEVLFEGVMPTPVVMQEISTPIPSIPEGYDWRDTKLTLSQALPKSPAEANVYSLKLSQPATMNEARALAQQFGINGEVTEIPGEIPGNFDYLIFDGRQKLTVRSDHYFTYHSNTENFTLTKPPEEQAQKIIDTSLKLLGFDFEYRLEAAPEMTGPHYYILPLTPDGFEMTFDYMMPLRFEITLEDIKNLIFSGYPLNFESSGTFGILTAEEAFQKVLSPNPQFGMMEIFRGNGGGGGGSSFYKLNLSGTPVSFPTPTAAPSLDRSEYVVQEGDTLTSIAGSHGINTEELMQINGLSESRIFIGQTLIIPRQLNIGQQFEGLRGLFTVNIYRNSNGSQRFEYGFILKQEDSPIPYMLLEGNELSNLEKYHNRPVDIWGIIDRYDNFGRPIIKVESYEVPYPDLEVQVLQGTQENIELDGNTAVLFTTNAGEKYIQLLPAGDLMVDPGIDPTQPQLFIEGFIIPNETYAGHPAFRFFTGGLVFNPQDGTPMEYETSIDQPYIMEDVPNNNSIPPTATIEKMDLAYYIRNPIYSMTDSNAGADAQYLQPVWRFYGHYSNGDEFEILIQALKDEFLYPELAPYTPPG